MTCRDILKKHLTENGFDGLVHSDSECGCGLDDLAPCDCLNLDGCVPAYRLNESDCDFCCAECESSGLSRATFDCYREEKPNSKKEPKKIYLTRIPVEDVPTRAFGDEDLKSFSYSGDSIIVGIIKTFPVTIFEVFEINGRHYQVTGIKPPE